MNGALLKSVIPIAVGAGVMVGAAGVFLYDQFIREKRRIILQNEVANLDVCVTELKRELEALKALQQKVSKRRRKKTQNSFVSDTETEVYSLDDDGDEVFFDFSDAEDDTLSLAEAKRQVFGSKYDEVDSLISGGPLDSLKAYGILLELIDHDRQNPEILWRLAKVCHSIAGSAENEGDMRKRQDFLNKGVEFAEECLREAPRSSDAHKWYAICIGARSQHLPTKEKVRDGIEFRRHVEQALELDPDDSTLHHLLGRFKFEVATLSWIERKVASALFGEIPEATFEETLQSLYRAEELSTDPWKENRLLIAKCYLHLGDNATFNTWLGRADQVPVSSPEDKVADAEIKVMKQKYKIQDSYSSD